MLLKMYFFSSRIHIRIYEKAVIAYQKYERKQTEFSNDDNNLVDISPV